MLQAKRYFEELYFLGARAQGGTAGAFSHPWTEPTVTTVEVVPPQPSGSDPRR